MGSTTSLAQQKASCGLCTKSFDYKKALEILKNSLHQYEESLQKNINEFKQKDQKTTRQDFNQVKQQAFNWIKNNQQLKARKLLTDYFNQLKQPKLITREIDFLDNKQKMLQKLRKNIENSVKPYKNQEKRNQIVQFDRQLQRIKQLNFNPNQDQKSNDSGDVESYIDRIMDELKSKLIPAPKKQQPVVVAQKKSSLIIIPQPQLQSQPVAREPSADQYRQKFLRKLNGSKITMNGQRFRRLTTKETEFFKNSLGIELTSGEMSAMVRKNNKEDNRIVWYGGQSEKRVNANDVQEIGGNEIMKISSDARGYYLNIDCNGFELFDMQELIKTDWPMIQVLDVQQCGISSHWWKAFANSQRRSLPNLKVVYFGLNQITQVNTNQLQLLNGVQYLSFGWWNESNQLSPESKRVISEFQSKYPQIKIQFPCA